MCKPGSVIYYGALDQEDWPPNDIVDPFTGDITFSEVPRIAKNARLNVT